MKQVKTFKNWKGSLNDYLQPGDLVDKEIADYFINILPPRIFTSRLIQIGEPYDYVNGKAVYATIKKTEDGWEYCGHCYVGETVDVRKEHQV